jgi:hypothetical protein
MSGRGPSRRFDALPAGEQDRFREWGRFMVGLAQSYAAPIIFGPRPNVEGVINGATGFVWKLSGDYFFVTALHVLEEYERRLHAGEQIIWQIGKLPPIDPISRIAQRSDVKDMLLLKLLKNEAHRVGSSIVDTQSGSPLPIPKEDDLVVVAGFTKELREVDRRGTIKSDGWAAIFRVTDVRDQTFDCRIGKEEDFVSFNELPLPDEDVDMGGLSGGPAFVVSGKLIQYLAPVGIVVHHIPRSFDDLKLLRIALLSGIAA